MHALERQQTQIFNVIVDAEFSTYACHKKAAINRELFSESEDGISDLDDDNQDNDYGSEGT